MSEIDNSIATRQTELVINISRKRLRGRHEVT